MTLVSRQLHVSSCSFCAYIWISKSISVWILHQHIPTKPHNCGTEPFGLDEVLSARDHYIHPGWEILSGRARTNEQLGARSLGPASIDLQGIRFATSCAFTSGWYARCPVVCLHRLWSVSTFQLWSFSAMEELVHFAWSFSTSSCSNSVYQINRGKLVSFRHIVGFERQFDLFRYLLLSATHGVINCTFS